MPLPLLKNAKNLSGKRVLLRLDFNIPVVGGVLKDAYRIEAIAPTLQFLKEAGVLRIIILSHHSDKKQSLKPMSRFLGKTVPNRFVADIFDTTAFTSDGDAVFVCENLRFWDGEENNDPSFTARLASLGDIYVNDAFSVSHRAHASIVGLPRLLPSYIGFSFAREVEELSRAFAPERPFLLALGGAKPETKIPLIEKFLPHADTIFVGGAVAHTFFRALGYEIGESFYEESSVDVRVMFETGKIFLPQDVVVKSDEGVFVRAADGVSPGEKILDAGPETARKLAALAAEARFIIWNGPFGEYLKPGFEKTSVAFAEAVGKSDARSIVGGGDTVALLKEHNLSGAFTFVSSGGGAMLQFLAEGMLPGIEALKK
ncbi:MAG: phosphoglycerate kinase [Parcubacteria group bacterium]|nr:phosphoglycerate kinase [Parcubacteria group bacterium]MBI3075178.1 phosphoglycerate kinase [Parcubacteria group bacterium]